MTKRLTIAERALALQDALAVLADEAKEKGEGFKIWFKGGGFEWEVNPHHVWNNTTKTYDKTDEYTGGVELLGDWYNSSC